MRVRLSVDVELIDGVWVPDDVAEALFNFLAADPDNVLPMIETVLDYRADVLS